jgi:hypothetical protein
VPTFLDMLTKNPNGWGMGSPLPNPQPSQGEIRNLPPRPTDPFATPIAEAISPTLGGFGTGQMVGQAAMMAGEGDLLGAAGPAALATFTMLPGLQKIAPGIKRKPMDWGGEMQLAHARRAELRGTPSADMWEQHGWARNPMSADDPQFNPAIPADKWYTEFGQSPAALGERYALGIGERKRTPPWQSPTDAPEAAFEAEVRYDPRSLLTDKEAPSLDHRKAATAKAAEARASFDAVDMAKRIRAAEDQMRAEGLGAATVAEKLKAEFGATVKADDLQTGQVWWRVTDKEKLGRGKWRPSSEVIERPDVQELIAKEFNAGKSHTDIASAIEKETGVPIAHTTVSRWARERGMTRDPIPPYRGGWTDEALATMAKAKEKGLTSEQTAELLNKEFPAFGSKLTAGAVRKQAMRRK